jgi:hypothetical protein
MKYIEDVPDDKVFVLGEKRIKNLYGLLFEFREMGEETYGFYAAEDHNYFADWVQHVIENQELADKLRATKSRKEAVEALESAVESMRKDNSPKQEKESLPVVEETKSEPKIEKVTIVEPEKRKIIEQEEEKLVGDITKEDKEAKVFLWKHFGWEMAKEFMYGLAFGILIGLILAKMFLR